MTGLPPSTVAVEFLQLPHGRGLPPPAYQTEHAAGMDLIAAVPDDAPMVLAPGAYGMVPTGLVIALPPGVEAQVRPRSGLAVKQGLTVLNSPGTIDADYRGEVQVLLVNLGADSVVVSRGMRIAQCVIATVTRATFVKAAVLDQTVRGSGGFGSTGS